MGFYILLCFCFGVTFWWRSLIFLLYHGVNPWSIQSVYRFAQSYLSFWSFNSVAAEFQFFNMLYNYCIIMQSWDIEAHPQSVSEGAPIVCLSLEFKQYLGERLFQSLTNFSLAKYPSIWYLLPYQNFFRLFHFVGGSETSTWRVQTFPLRPSL